VDEGAEDAVAWSSNKVDEDRMNKTTAGLGSGEERRGAAPLAPDSSDAEATGQALTEMMVGAALTSAQEYEGDIGW
jgi:hypothetical protein